MSNSFATVTPGNLILSPCRVTYKGVDLGATLGNVSIKVEEALAELKSDQYGSTFLDKVSSGFKVTVETELAEAKLKDNWKVVFPMHKFVSSGSKLMYFDAEIGTSQLSLAGELLLHPLSALDADLTTDFLFYLATADAKSEFHLSPSEQGKIKVTWEIYPDFTTTPPRFFIFGDPGVGLTNASSAAAVAATGNAGNGTVGSIGVSNQYTKTETITLLALTATKFQVSGSLSGQLGVATVGSGFTSNPVDLTITAGGTPFSAGDSFTIATTGPNYS